MVFQAFQALNFKLNHLLGSLTLTHIFLEVADVAFACRFIVPVLE